MMKSNVQHFLELCKCMMYDSRMAVFENNEFSLKSNGRILELPIIIECFKTYP